MKEFFDQLRDEAEQRELPQPAEVRARGDRRVARRGAAGAFSLAVVMAGGFIAARPLFHQTPSITADGVVSASPHMTAPETIAVPNVVGLSRSEATTVLQQQGFKVQVVAASPPPSGSPQAGTVRQQNPVSAKLIPGETITIWVDDPQEPTRVCADKYPKQLATALFVKADTEICYADIDPLATISESLPAPCPPSVLPSESLLEDRRGFTAMFEEVVEKVRFPTVLDQTISRYKGTGAKDYLTELAGEIGRCKSVMRGGARIEYSVVSQGQQETLGEQSLLIDVERRYSNKPETGPQVANFRVLVVRTGLFVVVIYDKGWEGTGSRPGTILDTAREMLRRLTVSPSPSR